MNKISLNLTVNYSENVKCGDDSLDLYRNNTIFLPDKFTHQELENLPQFKHIKRILQKKNVYVALIKCIEDKSNYLSNFTFVPICGFHSEINGTVTQTNWYDKGNYYFESGTVITINNAIQEIQNTMYNCQDWNKEEGL